MTDVQLTFACPGDVNCICHVSAKMRFIDLPRRLNLLKTAK
jgi:hypothetical protein